MPIVHKFISEAQIDNKLELKASKTEVEETE